MFAALRCSGIVLVLSWAGNYWVPFPSDGVRLLPLCGTDVLELGLGQVRSDLESR